MSHITYHISISHYIYAKWSQHIMRETMPQLDIINYQNPPLPGMGRIFFESLAKVVTYTPPNVTHYCQCC